MSEKTCPHCGVYESDHSRDVLAEECYPKMLDHKEKEILRLHQEIERLQSGFELMAKDCEETAAELVHEWERKPWLSMAYRIRHALGQTKGEKLVVHLEEMKRIVNR